MFVSRTLSRHGHRLPCARYEAGHGFRHCACWFRGVVVLVDERGAIGTAAKASVHHEATPLHLGFSCYVFDGDGRVLMTRRALGKRTWPACGRTRSAAIPAPGEADRGCGAPTRPPRTRPRRSTPSSASLPEFRYRAVAADGTVENEVCPVFCAAHRRRQSRPRRDEVMDSRGWRGRELRSAADCRGLSARGRPNRSHCCEAVSGAWSQAGSCDCG